ncbi:MAG: M16 family metallopeptidase [Hyphomicrobiaceae bacterium]
MTRKPPIVRSATPHARRPAQRTRGTHDAGVEITRLSNGVTVASQMMPHYHTVSVGLWVRAGARNETIAEHGISHLLEHMAFKGTTRRSARAIAEEIEQVGGDLNAMTSAEATAYYARVLRNDLPLAIDVLSDIVLDPIFDPIEFAREKDVILQEIAATEDSPDDVAYDLVHAVAFPDQAIGRPIIGTPASVSAIDVAAIERYRAAHYVTTNVVLCAVGNVAHAALVDLAETHLSALFAGPRADLEQPRFAGGWSVARKAFEQAHLVLAFDAPAYHSDDFFAAQVFTGALGGGMSSRLFQEVREARGLCYSIYASNWGIADGGLLTIHAATSRESLDELYKVVVGEIEAIADRGLDLREVERAKAQIRAGLVMSLESAPARAEQIARHLTAFGSVREAEEILAKVEAVDFAAVRAFAERVRNSRKPAVALVGAGRGADRRAERMLAQFGA